MKYRYSCKFFSALLILALSASLSFAEDLPVKPANPKWKITIPGKSGSLCNSPTYVAYEKGYFAEEGIDAELIAADLEANKIGLNNGTISTVNGDFLYFPAVETGVATKVVAGLHRGCIKLNVRPDSDINEPKDLIGKIIAVPEIGDGEYQVTLLWLARGGVRPDQVEFRPFNKDQSLELTALYNKQVDAAAVGDPLASVSVKEGKARTILDIGSTEPFAGHFCCFLYASTKLLEEQPELIAAELRAYRKAQNWIHENPEEAVKLVTERKYVAIEDHELALELIKGYAYPSTEEYAKGTWDVEGDVRYFAEALHESGFLQSDPAEFVEKAYAEVDLSK